MNSKEQELKQMKETFQNLKKEMAEKSKVLLLEVIKDLVFPPTIETIGWSQYTPYFNDGNECIFSAGCDIDHLFINEKIGYDCNELWESEYDYNTKEEIVNPKFDQEQYDFVNKFSDIISSIEEETLKDMFGDHCLVTVNRAGEIEVTDYEHD